MKKIDSSLFKNKIINPDETIYEIITAEDDLGWGMVLADFGESELHYHHQIREFYLVLEGELAVVVGEETHHLKKGESVFIQAGLKHKARAMGRKPARIAAFTFPAWFLEDHYLDEG